MLKFCFGNDYALGTHLCVISVSVVTEKVDPSCTNQYHQIKRCIKRVCRIWMIILKLNVRYFIDMHGYCNTFEPVHV